MRTLVPVLASLPLLLLAEPARAQEADTVHVKAAVWTLCPGSRVRVTDAAARVHTGLCVDAAEGALILATREGEARIPLAEVARVQNRRTADVWGAVAGGVLGLAIGSRYALRDVGCPHPPTCGDDFDRTDRGTVPKAAGVLIGAAVGAAVGRAIPLWRTRFPL